MDCLGYAAFSCSATNKSGRAKRKYISLASGIPLTFQPVTEGGSMLNMRAVSEVPPSASIIRQASLSIFWFMPLILGMPKNKVKEKFRLA